MRERIRRNVGLGMAVILLVSSLGVPPASAGTVRGGKVPGGGGDGRPLRACGVQRE